jgi:hypothetical protein
MAEQSLLDRTDQVIANPVLALRRTYGALVLSSFGACWLLLALYAFQAWRAPQISLIVLGWLAFLIVTFQIQRKAKRLSVNETASQARERDNKIFGIVNGVQWVLIFLVFRTFSGLGWGNFAFPVVIAIIGAHFFAMPPSYRYRSNTITGVLLILFASLSVLIWKGSDRMVAMASLFAGLIRWGSAAYALQFGRQLRDGRIR